MPISTVSLTNTFDEWRIRTNQIVTAINTINESNSTFTGTLTITNPSSFQGNVSLNVASGVIKGDGGLLVNLQSSVVAAGAYVAANAAFNAANTAPNSSRVNTIFTVANAAFNRANLSSAVEVGATAPAGPISGDLWWNSNYGKLLLYYNDGNSSQWVDTNPGSDAFIDPVYDLANAAFNRANAGFTVSNAGFTTTNTVYTIANASYTVANAAFGVANNAATTTNAAAAFAFANGVSTNTTAAFAKANAATVNTSSYVWSATQTFDGSSSSIATILKNAAEPATVSATAATGTINFDVTTQSVLYYISNASANWTVNFRGSSGTSMNTMMTTGQAITVAFLVTQGGTAYYNSAVQVDGNSITPSWQGGTAPTAGNASSIDIYTYTIIKTGSATFAVLVSQTQFK